MSESTTETRNMDAQQIIDELLQRTESRALVPATPRTEEKPTTVSSIAATDVEQAIRVATLLQEASIKLTYPEDWVMFKTRDGAEVCFLQDVGCERVRPLWGVSFDKVDLRQDFDEELLDDGHLYVSAATSAHCAVTGEYVQEIGSRSSVGFFEKAWQSAAEKPVERKNVASNIRKAAMANARGRVLRTIMGMSQVPRERLRECGLDVRKIRGVEMQEGTRGGSGSYASDAQVNKIVGEVIRQKKVRGLTMTWNELADKVKAASLSGGRGGKASKLIEKLMAAAPESITVEQFEQALGVSLRETSAAAGESPEETGQEEML